VIFVVLIKTYRNTTLPSPFFITFVFMPSISNKIYDTYTDLAHQVSIWQNDGETVVFTNGCFDLIHLGHIQYLREARSKGDRLIVALNSDRSVSAIKGSHRPINDEATRIAVMAAFEFTDAVVVFDEATPLTLIETILPNVLVKGGDWRIDQIVGSDVVLAHGGKVYSLSFIDGYSTTLLEQKIIASHK
jgi:D-glycero-beta-D-manno-heptose 1-phosphate adenylyltransferase